MEPDVTHWISKLCRTGEHSKRGFNALSACVSLTVEALQVESKSYLVHGKGDNSACHLMLP